MVYHMSLRAIAWQSLRTSKHANHACYPFPEIASSLAMTWRRSFALGIEADTGPVANAVRSMSG